MSESNDIQQLMRDAIEAAREGRKSEAKTLFQQVVDQDDKNEKAWMWLASVVDTDEERRVCLSNVLFINPGNERAQTAMAKLDAKAKSSEQDQELIPGVNRRQLLLIGGGGAAAVLLILVIFIALSSSRAAQDAEETRAALELQGTGTAVVQAATDVSANATATQLALATPTVPPTLEVRNTLPPETDLGDSHADVGRDRHTAAVSVRRNRTDCGLEWAGFYQYGLFVDCYLFTGQCQRSADCYWRCQRT